MKKIYSIIPAVGCVIFSYAQNAVSGPIGLYGPQYNPATTILTGGSVMVGNSGNWSMYGNIVSLDKGNTNSPIASGRSESIVFSGTGTYSGASTTPGTAGNIIDGYAGAIGQSATFILPLGNATTAYPLTVPANNSVTAAYFDGSGITQNTPVTGATGTYVEYSPFYDMPLGMPAGSYTFSYPSGFTTSSNGAVLTSNNSSVNGTKSNTAYSVLYSPTSFTSSGGSTIGLVAAQTATQVYFGNSSAVLPVTITNFSGTVSACMANLTWSTSLESNSKQYDIETSTDGVLFSAIGSLKSNNSPTGATYKFSSPLESGNNYFRLNSVDLDNSFAYSNTIVLNGNCSGVDVIKVSPNPTIGLFNLLGVDGGNTISIINSVGQTIMEKLATGGSIQLNMSQFANGNYYIRIIKSGKLIATKMLIKN